MSARRLGWVVLATAVVTLAWPHPAAATDDAGTRSIFAEGAGNRALALGGAYTALAMDASAGVWNPGGLGFVARREFQVSHTDYDLGFAQEYASFVLPNWRWGAASITYRRFGVEGVERVDDRNVSLGEDASNSETEITIAYGRPMGSAWSLGGAVKMQHQAISGYSGSGYGADIGIFAQPLLAFAPRVSWADRVTAGIMVRNAIQPAIRLNVESIRDPAVLRVGLGYRSPYLAAALDVERSGGVRPRVHAGAEYSPHPLLSLRGGMTGRVGTAGAGIRWQSWSLDYAFENEALSPVHRVGLSYAFGPTVAEGRTASLRAEEERVQTRLAKAFQEVQSERVDQLLARAAEARSQGRYDAALEIVATIATLEPGEPRSAALELDLLREHAGRLEQEGDLTLAALAYGRVLEKVPADTVAAAGQIRCRVESDRRAERSELQRKLFASAMDAFASDDLLAARKGFASILAANPNDEDAEAMLRRINTAIGKRAETLVAQALRDIDAGRLKEASGSIEQARLLDRRADGLLRAEMALLQARNVTDPPPATPEVVAPGEKPAAAGTGKAVSVAPPAKRPPLTPKQRRELDDLYRRGLTALEEKRPNDAVRYWELVWSADPKYARIADYLEREYLMRGMDAFAGGRLDDAIGWWERASEIDPDDERTKGYLARARKQVARTREILGEGR